MGQGRGMLLKGPNQRPLNGFVNHWPREEVGRAALHCRYDVVGRWRPGKHNHRQAPVDVSNCSQQIHSMLIDIQEDSDHSWQRWGQTGEYLLPISSLLYRMPLLLKRHLKVHLYLYVADTNEDDPTRHMSLHALFTSLRLLASEDECT